MRKFLLFLLSLIVSVGVSAETTSVWSGSYEFAAAGDGWQEVAAEKFADMKLGDKIIVTVSEITNPDGWAQINLVGKYPWTTVPGTNWGDVLVGENTYAIADADVLAIIKASGLGVQGKYFVLTDISIETEGEGPNFQHVTINYENAIRKEWLVPYYDIDNNTTAEVVVNHAAEINDWGIGNMHSWDSNVQDKNINANSNETYSTFVYTLSELIEFAGESDGFEFSFWNTQDVMPTIASITLSLNQITIPLTSAGIGSMILPFAAEVPQGMKVYAFDSYDGNGVLKMKSVEAIEANTPYIIKGEAKDYTFAGVAEADNFQYTVENLTGTYEEIKAPVGSFVLVKKDDSEAGFYCVKEGEQPTVQAHRAYLTLPAHASKIRLQFDDEATGIECMNAIESVGATQAYNLAGQRVSADAKGIVIMNGKKYLMK